MRAGNQTLGKTFAGLSNGIYHALGEHPFYPVPPPPTEGTIVTASWAQSLAIQAKLWALLPKDQLDPRTEYDPSKGFRGRYPVVRFKNGSKIWIKTTNQGGLALAGSTLHWVHFDEPPKSPRVFAEMVKRVTRTAGYVWITYTPVNAPVDYLREMVENGAIEDHWSPLTPEQLIPVGGSRPVRLPDGTLCDAAWIEELRADTLPHEIPVVIDGEWDMRVIGSVFRGFRAAGPDAHVSERLPAETVNLQIGIDHGSGANFSSAAVLIAVVADAENPRIFVIDEYTSDGETTIAQDAANILAMLRRWGKDWRDLHKAYGDRPWQRGSLQRKSNAQLTSAIERHLSRRVLEPEIRTVKRGAGRGGSRSVHMGSAFLHRAMITPGCFTVHPRCAQVIESLSRWDGRFDSPYKHILDALRYGLDNYIFGGYTTVRKPILYAY